MHDTELLSVIHKYLVAVGFDTSDKEGIGLLQPLHQGDKGYLRSKIPPYSEGESLPVQTITYTHTHTHTHTHIHTHLNLQFTVHAVEVLFHCTVVLR